ncbi:MAG: hypothetical protein WC365_09360 [Candidatus Babeliales bacterium]|jgi:predicted RNA-binding Zn-ribbon protein involved in translation (DUF1610 family)
MNDFGVQKEVKTRTKHSCIFCQRSIPIGTLAIRCSGKYEGDMYNFYACAYCTSIEDIIKDARDGISGDGYEFTEWVRTAFSKCFNCGNVEDIDTTWTLNEKTLMFTCNECGHEWTKYIGFEAALAEQLD